MTQYRAKLRFLGSHMQMDYEDVASVPMHVQLALSHKFYIDVVVEDVSGPDIVGYATDVRVRPLMPAERMEELTELEKASVEVLVAKVLAQELELARREERLKVMEENNARLEKLLDRALARSS